MVATVTTLATDLLRGRRQIVTDTSAEGELWLRSGAVSAYLRQSAQNDSIILLASAAFIGVGNTNNCISSIISRSRAIV